MKISSDAFSEGQEIPSKFTCQGEDISPKLSWEDVPDGAKSLALIVYDPDAPVGTWVHWLIKDIPVTSSGIEEGSSIGVEVENSFGKKEYGGPCPPSGTHRYFFKLYALDVESFDADNKKEFYEKVEEHKIAETQIMGIYEKS